MSTISELCPSQPYAHAAIDYLGRHQCSRFWKHEFVVHSIDQNAENSDRGVVLGGISGLSVLLLRDVDAADIVRYHIITILHSSYVIIIS